MSVHVQPAVQVLTQDGDQWTETPSRSVRLQRQADIKPDTVRHAVTVVVYVPDHLGQGLAQGLIRQTNRPSEPLSIHKVRMVFRQGTQENHPLEFNDLLQHERREWGLPNHLPGRHLAPLQGGFRRRRPDLQAEHSEIP